MLLPVHINLAKCTNPSYLYRTHWLDTLNNPQFILMIPQCKKELRVRTFLEEKKKEEP